MIIYSIMYKRKMSVKFMALIAAVCLIATSAPLYPGFFNRKIRDYLAPQSAFEQKLFVKFESRKFPDGELQVYILDYKAIEGKSCVIQQSTETDEDIVELILGVGLLRDLKAKKIAIILPKSSITKTRFVLDALSEFCEIATEEGPYTPSQAHLSSKNKSQHGQAPELVLFTPEHTELKEKVAIGSGLPVETIAVKTLETGEITVDVPHDVNGKNILLIHSTKTNKGLVELIAILEALRQNGANNVGVLFPYFGYARQHKPYPLLSRDMPFSRDNPPSANSAKMILDIINRYCSHIYTVNIHFLKDVGLQTFPEIEGLDITNLNALLTICNHLQKKYSDLQRPILVGADSGVFSYVSSAAETLGLASGHFNKKRFSSEKVVISPRFVFDGNDEIINVAGRDVVLLDDEISTGGTIVEAATILKELGARKVFVGCVHGKFAKGLKIFNGIVDDVVSTDAVVGPKSEASLAELIIDNLKKPRNAHTDLLENNPETIAILQKRMQLLFEKINLPQLLRRKISEDPELKDIDMDKATIVLYGDFLWHSEKDAPNDIDILIITQARGVRYRRVWTLSSYIPKCEVIIRGIDDPEMRKNLPLAMLGWGKIIHGDSQLIDDLKIPLTDIEILNWSNQLKNKGWQNLSLGNELGDYGRCWKRLFEAYLYLRPLLQKYMPDKIESFEREVFGHPLSDFYQLFYTGKIEKLPWQSEDADTELWQFHTKLDRLTTELRSLLFSAHEDELRRAP